jgi:hypothetical protein
MKASRKLKRIQERRFSAHHMLIRAAAIALERGKKKQPGWLFDELSAMTYSALAIEALCNSVGDLVISDWDKDFEMAPTAAKLRVLTKHLGIPYDKAKEPWSTAKDLGKFRNLVAHAKPQLIVEEEVMSQEEYDARLFDVPKSKLENQINSTNAARAVAAVERIKDIFIEKLDAEQKFGLTSDGWSGSTKAHDG